MIHANLHRLAQIGEWRNGVLTPLYGHTVTRYTPTPMYLIALKLASVIPSRAMAYLYATAFPGDIVKLGCTERHKMRALDGQTYYVQKLEVLGLWHVTNARLAEWKAHLACLEWHVRNELYRVPTHWLDLEHPIVTKISTILGKPLQLAEDVGAIPDNLKWPCTCIDWDQAARELKYDYTSADFDGVTYYYRS